MLSFLLNSLFGANINYEEGFIPRFDKFSIIYSSFIVAIIVFPILLKKDLGILMKFNSLGVYFATLLGLYILYTGFSSLSNTDFDYEYYQNEMGTKNRHLLLYGPNPFKLAGSVTLGYSSHTFIISIMRNNQKPENNDRDLAIGYSLVGITYLLFGIMGYIGFSGHVFSIDFKDVS